jgi:hypothetical protein
MGANEASTRCGELDNEPKDVLASLPARWSYSPL